MSLVILAAKVAIGEINLALLHGFFWQNNLQKYNSRRFTERLKSLLRFTLIVLTYG